MVQSPSKVPKKCPSPPVSVLKQKYLPYFLDYKVHFPPKFGGRWGVSYSPNVAYLARCCRGRCGDGGGIGSQEAGAGPHFLLQFFFPIFFL